MTLAPDLWTIIYMEKKFYCIVTFLFISEEKEEMEHLQAYNKKLVKIPPKNFFSSSLNAAENKLERFPLALISG